MANGSQTRSQWLLGNVCTAMRWQCCRIKHVYSVDKSDGCFARFSFDHQFGGSAIQILGCPLCRELYLQIYFGFASGALHTVFALVDGIIMNGRAAVRRTSNYEIQIDLIRRKRIRFQWACNYTTLTYCVPQTCIVIQFIQCWPILLAAYAFTTEPISWR